MRHTRGAVRHVLRLALARGAVVTLANWPVAVIQATADALLKLLVLTPVVGGLFLVALVVDTAPGELVSLDWRPMAAAIAAALLAHPLVLVAFLAAVAVSLVGGTLFVLLAKGGTLGVLLAGERASLEQEGEPAIEWLPGCARFTVDRFAASASRLFPRYATLAALLTAVYAACGGAYLASTLGLPDGPGGLPWVALVTAAFVLVITAVNVCYLLVQIVVAAEDCPLVPALRQTARFVRHTARDVGVVAGATLALMVAASAASLLAAAAVGLIGFVPVFGLALLPLQLGAWVLRSWLFQCLGLTAAGAYATLYRQFAERRPLALASPTLGAAVLPGH